MSKDREYLESVLKELFKAEVDRSDKLDTAVAIPIGIISVLLGGSIAIVDQLLKGPYSSRAWCFSLLLAIAFLLAVVTTIVFLVKSFYRQKYMLISLPSEIYDYAKNLEKTFAKIKKGPDLQEATRIELIDHMISQYAQVATYNRKRNEARISYFRKTIGGILFSVALFVLCRFAILFI